MADGLAFGSGSGFGSGLGLGSGSALGLGLASGSGLATGTAVLGSAGALGVGSSSSNQHRGQPALALEQSRVNKKATQGKDCNELRLHDT